jgi:putative ABC transport system permease protein
MNIAKLAYKNLWIRSSRTLLTIVGVSIVVAIFFSLFSFGNGYKKALEGEFSSLGIHILAVPKGCPYEATSLLLHGGEIESSLSFTKLEEVRNHPEVRLASPMYSRHTKINPEQTPGNYETALYAIENDLFLLKPFWKLAQGSVFSNNDAKEVILGSQTAQILQASLGQEITFIVHVGEEKTKVSAPLVGILEQSGTSDDNFIFIPFGWIKLLLGEDEIIKAVAIQTVEGSSIASVSEALSQIKDVQTVTYRQAQYTLQQLLETTRQLLNLALLFTLFLGLIGLVNTMLMSIEERKKEIGMLKALGAKNQQLLQLILFETMIMVFIAAILGILWSLAFSSLIETGIRTLVESAPPGKLSLFSISTALMTVFVAVVVGVISVLLPATSLLKISPLEVIRNE